MSKSEIHERDSGLRTTDSRLSLSDRCRKIELLVLDVDGVLSNGDLIYSESGNELKGFFVRDGSGIKLWQRTGKHVAILSGRTTSVTNLRAKELGIDLVVQGPPEKLPGYRRMLHELQMQPEQVSFVGDDLPDLPILDNCGLAVAVADASPDLLGRAHYVTRTRGGRGAVREVIELILQSQGSWPNLVKGYYTESL